MIVRSFAFAAALAAIPQALLAQSAATPVTPSAAMQTYCVSCHSGPAAKGHFSLDRVDVNNPAKDSEAWERVVRQLRAHTMPVMGAARPDRKTYESTISTLTDAMDRAAIARKPLAETEIANRLARLVWNTEPDRPLLDAAAKGQLHDTAVLQTHVRRMLGDPKSSAFVTGFFGTWLSLDQLTAMKHDSALFPEFDELRGAMRRETELFIGSQLRDDRNPLELWTANYTFLNERLARHYGVPGISGPEYRRVTWPGDERAGLLGQGSILTLTSYPFNAYPVDVPTTSPAQRGKWILTRALGVNPPATVPNVPSPDYPFAKHTPLVAQSRTFPATPCLACHRSFFPLSYALENFDVLGRWRSDYGPGAINASGSMVDGTQFNGPVEFRRALLERSDAFLNLLAEKLLAYADGGPSAIDRATPPARMPIVRSVLRESKAQNYSWSSLIAAIAKAPSEDSAAQRPAPPIRRIDHIMIRADDPAKVFAFFTEVLQLPVAWPLMSPREGVATGGVGFGNVIVEAIRFPAQKRQPSPAQLLGFGFEPSPLATALAELDRRDITYGDRRPLIATAPDGSKNTLWTNVTLRQFSDGEAADATTTHIFLSEYSPRYVNVEERRERLRRQLAERSGGPLGVEAVKEVIVAVSDLDAARSLWQRLLDSAPSSNLNTWQVGDGPAIRLLKARENASHGLVITVASLPRAKAFLREKGLLGAESKEEATIEPSKVYGLNIRVVGKEEKYAGVY